MVSGETLAIRKYYDPITDSKIEVEMSIRDHILFRLLKIIGDKLG